MKNQVNQLIAIIFLLIFSSCTKPEIENIDEDIPISQIEIVENPKSWGIPGGNEWQDPTPLPIGLIGPSNLNALQLGTFTYNGDPNIINQIPSKLKKYRFFIFREGNSHHQPWVLQEKYEINSNKISLKFPKRGNGTTVWAVGCHAFNTNTGIGTGYQWKTVTVNNN